MAETTRVTVEEVRQRLDRGDELAFVDARNPQAWAAATATLPGAIRVPADRVTEHLPKLPRDRAIITYCT